MPSSADATRVTFHPAHSTSGYRAALLLLIALAALRLATAAFLPLSFDEAYFWLWSKHLAISYFEHPPLIAFAIRSGTALLGDTELGVRLASLFASLAASWAVWRAAALIFGGHSRAWTACVYFNATLMLASQGMAATPDIFVMAASAFLLLAIAKLQQSQDRRWWIGVGLALGAAMLAKYTAFFLALSVLVWTVVTPDGRRSLRSPWPYLAATIAVACLLPNLAWNDAHGWMSFKYQFGRIAAGRPGLQFVLEFLGAQIALASPCILLLGAIGLTTSSTATALRKPLAMAVALVWPAVAYFTLHALHDRVQGNWPSFVYPGLAILAASVEPIGGRWQGFIGWIQRSALPAAIAVLFVAYLQMWTGLLVHGKADPIARMTGIGLDRVTARIGSIAQARHAGALVTTRYFMSGWLSFYVRPHLPVLQPTEGFRWSETAKADEALLSGELLYVTERPDRELGEIKPYFMSIKPLECIPRTRNGVTIDRFCVFSLHGLRGGEPLLDARIVNGAR
ncbi:MAG TPA: glycosyltransferase family 39 protein [Rhizomicrobium sp.]|nr:glycosyltransferase family 39 protein [Rhizomicrobium sp.]